MNNGRSKTKHPAYFLFFGKSNNNASHSRCRSFIFKIRKNEIIIRHIGVNQFPIRQSRIFDIIC